MFEPMRVHAMLHDRTHSLLHPVADFDCLCDTATVTWIAARLLQRYAYAHSAITDPVQAVRLRQAFQVVEYEMLWIRLCGEVAGVDEISRAVSNAVVSTQRAVMLLEMDTAGSSIPLDVTYADNEPVSSFNDLDVSTSSGYMEDDTSFVSGQ